MADRTFSIDIQGNAKSALAAFAATRSGAVKTQGAVTARMATMGAATKAAMLGVGAAAVAGGVGLVKLGKSFKEAENTIRVGTGATGKALAGLKKDFKGVLRDVPAEFDDAATAIADVNTRLGLTGKPLREVAGQFLELSRITGEDLGSNIASVTRLFGDWGIEGKKVAPTMDKLFRASQATGISIDDLAVNMVRFGSPLRQLGVDFDFATAMFANFEKAGVATETLMPGMRMSLKNLSGEMPKVAKELEKMGIKTGDVEQGFKDAFEAIENAGSTAEANTIAFKVFGVRAGPDMAAAIREGKFSLDDLQDAIVNGGDTIRQAGKDTQDFGEKWQLLKNRIFVVLEPLATKLFDSLMIGMDGVGRAANALSEAFHGLPPSVQGVLTTFGGIVLAVGAVIGVLGVLVTVLGPVTIGLKALGAALLFVAANPIVLLIAGLLAAVVAAYVFRDQIVSALTRVRDFFQTAFGIIAAVVLIPVAPIIALTALIVSNWDRIRGAVTTAVGVVVDVIQGLVSWITGTFVPFWVGVWDAVKGPLEVFLNVVRRIFQIFVVIVLAPVILVAAFIISHWDKIRAVTTTVFNAILTVIRTVFATVVGFLTVAANAALVVVRTAWEMIRTSTSVVWTAVGDIVGLVWRNVLRPVWEAIRDHLLGPLAGAFRGFREVVSVVWNAIRDAASSAWNFLRDKVFKPLMNFISDEVMPKFRGMRDGIASVWNSVKRTTKSVWDSIVRNVKGPVNSIIGFVNSLIGGINKVLGLIPGLKDLKIPKIPELGEGGKSGESKGFVAGVGLAAGGFTPVGGGFRTNGPQAIVGEGRRQYPEFVIPTDPQYSRRAQALYGMLGQELLPRMGIGGFLGDAFDKGKSFIGDKVSAAGGFLGDLARKALTGVFDPVVKKAISGLEGLPNVMHLPKIATAFANHVWDWVKGVDEGLPREIEGLSGKISGGSFKGGAGVARWRGVGLKALTMAGQSPSWIGDLLTQMQHESGGNPTVVNRWDSNWIAGHPSVGLMQMIRGSYQSNKTSADKGPYAYGVSMDPLANVSAAVRYTVRKFGTLGRWRAGGFKGYDVGGIVDNRGGRVHPGEMVLTRADQVGLFDLIRSGGVGGAVTINMAEGAVQVTVPRGASEEEARRAARGATKGYMDVVSKRKVLTDAKLR